MKILSIDPGIRNLAFCLFEKNAESSDKFIITKWDIVNISEEESFTCQVIDKKKNILCNKPAKYCKDDLYCCLKHAKIQSFHIPTKEISSAFINKQKIQKLYEIANQYKIQYNDNTKKSELVSLINTYIASNYFKEIKSKNASKVNLFSIAANIKIHFNNLFSTEEKIDYVIIENQISPIATRMKTIQGMLVQYFVMSPIIVDNIDFISASNKLKNCDIKDKKNYSDRKKLGITKCLETITNDNRFQANLEYFNQHKKKDDLSDSFLQGLWFINENTL